MKNYLRDQVDWPQSFPAEEYATRRAKVRNALKDSNLDAILVTTPANIIWLTGYDMIWYHLQNLTGLLVWADSDDTVFFDSTAQKTLHSVTPEISEVVYVDSAAFPALLRKVSQSLLAVLPIKV